MRFFESTLFENVVFLNRASSNAVYLGAHFQVEYFKMWGAVVSGISKFQNRGDS